jgi:hypothetical protein
MRNEPSLFVTSAFAIIAVVATAGCTGVAGEKNLFSKKMPWSKDKDKPEPYPNPAKMAVTWTPDTLVQTGRTPTRGFGGRLFFYDEKTKPVPVEGELTVHAFAESVNGTEGEVKRYHFTADQFTKHFSQTDIGASYSVWIPWDAVGGDQTKVSLVPSFRTANGRLVQGEQALVGLPGKRPKDEALVSRPTATSILAASRDSSKSGLVTTTIPVRTSLDRDTTPPVPRFAPTEAIAAKPQSTLRSFDVPPLQKPLQMQTTVVKAGQNTQPSLPVRLGRGSSPTSNVVPASATMPEL